MHNYIPIFGYPQHTMVILGQASSLALPYSNNIYSMYGTYHTNAMQ